MAWKKIISVDPTNASTVDNSFITINADESVEVISFNNLPAIDPADYAGLDTIPEVLADDPSNFLLSVHDVDDAKHKKLSLDNLAGFLTTQIVLGANLNANTTVQGLGTGATGDLNGDGEVSVADMLQLLTSFGQAISEADNAIYPRVRVYDGADVSIGSGVGNATVLDQSYWAIDSGAQLDITTVAANDLFQIEDGPLFLGDLSSAAAISINTSEANTFSYIGTTLGQKIRFLVRYKVYNSTGTLLTQQTFQLGVPVAVTTPGTQQTYSFDSTGTFYITSQNASYVTVEFLAYEDDTTYGCVASIDSINVKLVW